MLSFITWSPDPAIFHLGSLEVRYYGLLFALGFIIGQQIIYYIFKKEGRPESDVDTLTFYMIAATVIGARLGHVLFYEPEKYLSRPLDILKVWEGGLASHGAAAAILFILWVYSRKKKVTYLWILDRIVIVVALAGAMIRTGNFMNSEIIGKPTESSNGVVFMRDVEYTLTRNYPQLAEVESSSGDFEIADPYVPVNLEVTFNGGFEEEKVKGFIENILRNDFAELATDDEPKIAFGAEEEVRYELKPGAGGTYVATIQLAGIARHPAQLYEALSCIIIFLGLFYIWTLKKEKTPEGIIFGIFLIVLFGLRFLYEFLKENQVSFEDGLALNMGQILSIPLVLAGVVILIRALNTFKNTKS